MLTTLHTAKNITVYVADGCAAITTAVAAAVVVLVLVLVLVSVIYIVMSLMNDAHLTLYDNTHHSYHRAL